MIKGGKRCTVSRGRGADHLPGGTSTRTRIDLFGPDRMRPGARTPPETGI